MADQLNVCRFTPTLGGTTDWTPSAVVAGYQSPANAGAVTGAPYKYRSENADLSQWEDGEGIWDGTKFLRTTVLENSSGTGTLQSGAGTKINFSTVPQVAIVLLADDVVRAITPQGRVTPTSLTAFIRSSVANATTIYWTPYGGNRTPIAYGTRIVSEVFSELSLSTTDATKSPAACVPNSNCWALVWNDNGTKRFSRSDYWKKSATVTMTIASPCVVTWSGSDFADGTPIVFTTSGALPTGLAAGTTYFVNRTGAVGTPTATFNVAATVGGAAINTSGSQSGTHTGTAGDDSGSVGAAVGGNCEVQWVNGLPFNKNAVNNGPGAAQGQIVAMIRTNASAMVDMIFGGSGSGGVAIVFGICNVFNTDDMVASSQDNAASHNYTSATIRQAGGASGTGNQGSFATAFPNGSAYAKHTTFCSTAAINAICRTGIGVNSVTAFYDDYDFQVGFLSGEALRQRSSAVINPPQGWNSVALLEQGDGTNANVFNYISLQKLTLRVKI